ncbi:MAG: Radical SAM superfamily enzyme, MoaA/NifB/PqqE/SkfB family [Candidatus Kentron sp. G]|nr:MAG: Radical SAM superfamily enzyme, MoaA/NifB/PqqE/SkfB family [Candidatus Kentron sp. G]VFM96881.1 MAG: Radical SAM superfamily enzyme, MoaA/NifB/PqqE/SkfB family [Candidatus Kentron sp. G]VFM99641.1 MAG: Radical SAM superfamily enzyme, MoaA/NifB/PqqE/SkfB family [Candidatus Kentron sp. G]
MPTYYSSLKFLNFQDRLQALKDGDIAAPVHVRLKPTNKCNHNCWYCAYRTDNVTLGNEMRERDSIPEGKMLELAHEFVQMGIKAVTFSGGGEPLLYKPLPRVIDILAGGDIRIATLTNGANLKGRMADAFARHGTWIRISMDAWDDASYVEARGAKPQDFSRLIENIRAFTARDTQCVLGVSFIVGRDNHSHVAEVCARLKDCGVDHVKISGAVVSNDATGNNAYHSDIKPEVARQIERAQSLTDETFTILNHYHDLEDRFRKNYHTCPFLQFLTVIGADMNVYTCQDKAYTGAGRMGSIAHRSFKEFWYSEENRAFLKTFDPTLQCNHHCISHGKNLAIHEYLSLDQEHGYFV